MMHLVHGNRVSEKSFPRITTDVGRPCGDEASVFAGFGGPTNRLSILLFMRFFLFF